MSEIELRSNHISNKLNIWKRSLSKKKLMERALLEIANWNDFPETGEYWDEEKTRPMSYGGWYGTNGERDYMRTLARYVLNEIGEYEKELDK